MDPTPNLLVLWIGLLVASLTDLRDGKIRNWLTFPLMVFGVAYHAMVGPDRWLGLVGLAAATALHFTLFALGIQRAGDAKLFMGLGACVGWVEMVEASLWFALLYVPVGLATLAAKGRLSNLVATVRYVAQRSMGRPSEPPPESTMMIAGPTILVAGVIATTSDVLRDWLFG